jgi:hypothetical protein
MTAWSRLRAFLAQAGGAPAALLETAEHPFDSPGVSESSTEPSALGILLDQIEATALSIYAAHGLPDRQGHYARHPRTRAWTFIAEHLTPPERFALLEANPPEDGWRFGRLQDIGQQSEDALLSAAGALLEGVAAMRSCRAGSTTEDDLHAAIRLGEAWRAVREGQTPASSRLVLTAPEDDVADAASPSSR